MGVKNKSYLLATHTKVLMGKNKMIRYLEFVSNYCRSSRSWGKRKNGNERINNNDETLTITENE